MLTADATLLCQHGGLWPDPVTLWPDGGSEQRELLQPEMENLLGLCVLDGWFRRAKDLDLPQNWECVVLTLKLPQRAKIA